MPSPSPRGVSLSIVHDDDAAGAAEVLLAVLRRPEPADTDDEPESEPDAAA